MRNSDRDLTWGGFKLNHIRTADHTEKLIAGWDPSLAGESSKYSIISRDCTNTIPLTPLNVTHTRGQHCSESCRVCHQHSASALQVGMVVYTWMIHAPPFRSTNLNNSLDLTRDLWVLTTAQTPLAATPKLLTFSFGGKSSICRRKTTGFVKKTRSTYSLSVAKPSVHISLTY